VQAVQHVEHRDDVAQVHARFVGSKHAVEHEAGRRRVGAQAVGAVPHFRGLQRRTHGGQRVAAISSLSQLTDALRLAIRSSL